MRHDAGTRDALTTWQSAMSPAQWNTRRPDAGLIIVTAARLIGCTTFLRPTERERDSTTCGGIHDARTCEYVAIAVEGAACAEVGTVAAEHFRVVTTKGCIDTTCAVGDHDCKELRYQAVRASMHADFPPGTPTFVNRQRSAYMSMVRTPSVAATVRVLALVLLAPVKLGCAGFPDVGPTTSVVLENRYPTTPDNALVVYDAHWQNVSFQGQHVPSGASSAPQVTVPASADNEAYVVLAPGWDPTSTTPPTTFMVLQSRSGFAVALGDTLDIPVDDVGFEGNCAAGSRLTQEQADFLTQIVFASDFAGLQYDASTCTTTQIGEAGAP